MLLLSSITYGFAMLESYRNKLRRVQVWLGVTGLFGLAFLGIELYEFAHLIHEGATPPDICPSCGSPADRFRPMDAAEVALVTGEMNNYGITGQGFDDIEIEDGRRIRPPVPGQSILCMT